MTIKNRADLNTQTDTDIPNNTTKEVSSLDIRNILKNIFDSFMHITEDEFITTSQIITPAGTLTIAHGRSFTPTEYSFVLENVTSELNHSPGDKIGGEGLAIDTTKEQGVNIWCDATNINVQIAKGSGAGTPVFTILDNTGTVENITNVNWKIIIKVKR